MRPPHLNLDDTVTLVAPARRITKDEITFAVDKLKSWGLKVHIDENLFNAQNQFGGTDEQRIMAFQSAISNPEIKAVFCVRGGYGITRIIDKIDFTPLLENPKWLCGYSDVTAFLFHLYKLGIESIHSTMPMLFERDNEESKNSLKKILFGEEYKISSPAHSLNRFGEAEGDILGGNLSIVNTLIGTSSDVATDGVILFLEDIDEYLYNIDRMLVHLKRAGKLNKIAGLIVGHMTDMKDNAIPFGTSAYEIVQHWVDEYNYPVCYNFPVGHEPVNLAIPVGRRAKLYVREEGGKLTF